MRGMEKNAGYRGRSVATGAIVVAAALPFAGTAAAARDSWSSGTPLPNPVTWSAAAVVGNRIYVVGGINAASATISGTEVYDPATKSWAVGVPLPVPLWGTAAATLKGNLYVFGGYESSGTVSSATYELQPNAKKWRTRAPMLTAQGSARAVVYKNIAYVIGGNTSGQDRIATVESYNPATNGWTSQPSLLVGKSEISAGVVNGTIVAADGYTSSGDTGDNEVFKIGWTGWSPLVQADPMPRNGACTGMIGGTMYISDGDNNSNNPVSVNESYNYKKNGWELLTSMPQTLTDSSFVVYDKQLYCIGGGSSATPFQGNVYSFVQIYTP
ncbi:MAG TPA: kelch repeat-containing protein [Acetobacteraceae bacterium]|nr:kelch repeat-containing protein [Acetobacteraceae bacterium]